MTQFMNFLPHSTSLYWDKIYVSDDVDQYPSSSNNTAEFVYSFGIPNTSQYLRQLLFVDDKITIYLSTDSKSIDICYIKDNKVQFSKNTMSDASWTFKSNGEYAYSVRRDEFYLYYMDPENPSYLYFGKFGSPMSRISFSNTDDGTENGTVIYQSKMIVSRVGEEHSIFFLGGRTSDNSFKGIRYYELNGNTMRFLERTVEGSIPTGTTFGLIWISGFLLLINAFDTSELTSYNLICIPNFQSSNWETRRMIISSNGENVLHRPYSNVYFTWYKNYLQSILYKDRNGNIRFHYTLNGFDYETISNPNGFLLENVEYSSSSMDSVLMMGNQSIKSYNLETKQWTTIVDSSNHMGKIASFPHFFSFDKPREGYSTAVGSFLLQIPVFLPKESILNDQDLTNTNQYSYPSDRNTTILMEGTQYTSPLYVLKGDRVIYL